MPTSPPPNGLSPISLIPPRNLEGHLVQQSVMGNSVQEEDDGDKCDDCGDDNWWLLW